MSDADTRALARSDDPADLERLRHQRCRQGECCAHAGDTVPLGAVVAGTIACHYWGDRLKTCDSPVFLRACREPASGLCASCCDAHACEEAVPNGR